MWWLITLLILALIAFFIVKMMKSKTLDQQSQHEQSQQERLADAEAAQAHEASTKNASRGDSALTSSGAEAAGIAGVASGVGATATAVMSSNLSSGDTLADVREMIKILNLDRPDAGRLQISSEQLMALRQGQTDNIPDADTMNVIANKLRNMLA